MKDIKKIIREEVSNINVDGKTLDRTMGYTTIKKDIIKQYTDNGYKPYHVEGTILHEIPTTNGDLKNKWGYIYFFNDKEMETLKKLSDNITEIKSQLKKQIDLYDKYLISFIHTSGKI